MKKILVIILGIAILVGGFVYKNYSENLAKRCTVEAPAKVVDIEEEEDWDDGSVSYVYYPVIEYEANGTTINKKHNSGSNPSKYSIGDSISVMYNPENVQEYVIVGDNSSQFVWILLVVIGGVFILVGVFGKF